MWFITPLFVVFLALGAIDAAPNLVSGRKNFFQPPSGKNKPVPIERTLFV
jgi:hypothetical protein